MPKVIVYVRAEDARTIEAIDAKAIEEWVRDAVKVAIEERKERHAAALFRDE